ncbi:MAG: hypothetical protein KAT56_10325 [Sedimentisphaerales bacterium]|nr:hypothetical protein [Sedimentisphaerales bacterium]
MKTEIKDNILRPVSRAKTDRNVDARRRREEVVVKRNVYTLRVPTIQNDTIGTWAEEPSSGRKAKFITPLRRRNVGRFGRVDNGGEPTVIASGKGQQCGVRQTLDGQPLRIEAVRLGSGLARGARGR